MPTKEIIIFSFISDFIQVQQMIIIFDGSIRFTAVIGLGGQHVTADLSHGLRTPSEQAEEIKKKYGFAMQSMIEEDEIIRVPGIHGRSPREISRGVLCAIIQPRMEEIFSLSLNELERSGMYDSLGAGIVLTGGASLLPGSVELAEKTLGLPVKVGLPVVKGGLAETVNSPMFATGVGLIQYALTRTSEDKTTDKGKSSIEKFVNRIKEYFEDLF